jgi:hypothetical protein
MNRSGRAFWTVAVLMTSFAPGSAFGDWWIVRSSDEKCLVVDVEPTPATGVTKIGKDKYGSAQEAEAVPSQLLRRTACASPAETKRTSQMPPLAEPL